MDLVEETGGADSRPLNTALTAWVSAISPRPVEVPCALMYPISDGVKPARLSARRMQAAAPAPSGWGAVTRCASVFRCFKQMVYRKRQAR